MSERSTADVVFVHGFAADRLSWLATTAALDANRALLLDLPGHGRKPAPVGDGSLDTLVEWLRRQLANRVNAPVHLVGHSLGGGLALRVAAEHPGLVKSLFLVSPAGLGKRVDSGFLGAYPAITSADEMRALLGSLVAREQLISRQLVDYALAQLERPGVREGLTAIAAAVRDGEQTMTAAAQIVASSALPRHVVWGSEDTVNPLVADALAAFGASTIFDGAGHLPHVERARAVNDLLAAHVAAS